MLSNADILTLFTANLTMHIDVLSEVSQQKLGDFVRARVAQNIANNTEATADRAAWLTVIGDMQSFETSNMANPTRFSKNVNDFVKRFGVQAVSEMNERVLANNIVKFMSDVGASLAKRQLYIDAVKEYVAKTTVTSGVLKDDMRNVFDLL